LVVARRAVLSFDDEAKTDLAVGPDPGGRTHPAEADHA
jgi:hypothetical protein